MSARLPTQQRNIVTPRDATYFQESIVRQIIPRRNITNLVENPPIIGAIAYNTLDNHLYYADGTQWILVTNAFDTNVTLSNAGTLGSTSLVVNEIGPNLSIRGLLANSSDITVANSGTNTLLAVAGASAVQLLSTNVGTS
jgi:hypothetical protein